MACEKVTNVGNNPNNPTSTKCIRDVIRAVDQIQKEALLDPDCIGCTGPLRRTQFDTRPIIFTLQDNSKFTALFGMTNETTDLFRIEDIMGDCCLLRLLDRGGGCVTCTNQTAIINLNCICGLQCLEPINCKINENCRF